MLKRIFLLFMVLSLLSACSELQSVLENNLQKPEVSYKSLSLGSLSSNSIELKPVFAITNPNAFALPVDAVSYHLAFNQKTMLDGQTSNIGKLPANGSKEVTVSVPLNKEVFQAFSELLLNNQQLDYEIAGDVQVMGMKIPFSKRATFYRPSLSIGKLDVKQASFDKLELLLTVNIDNRNDFSLPLESLHYSASSGGKSLFSGGLSATTLKQGQSQLQLPLSVSPAEVFSSFLSMLTNPKLPLTLAVDGPLLHQQKNVELNLKQLF